MNGAESLVRTLVASGVEVCFSNPGTSEMHFVAALDRVPGMRAVLGLFEGAVTGMADGYGRMAEKPACTLLHLGPGLANGLANLHNARRAATPVVNIVGDHATYHAQYDAPLASDIMGFARPVSAWVHSSPSALTVASDGARAVHAALQPPGQIATLILPADTAWNEAEGEAPALPRPEASRVSDDAVVRAVAALKNGKKTTILIRGAALKERGLIAAGRIAARSGARIACDTFTARLQRGAGRVMLQRVPYFAEQIVEFFQDTEQLIIVGSKPPVSFFAYPGKPSWGLPDGATIHYLAHAHEDGVGALEALAGAVGAPKDPAHVAPLKKSDGIDDKFNQHTIGQVIARHLPEGAIISDEGATSGAGTAIATTTAAPHDHLALTGGSIGQGLPVATGAAVAAPDRKVVCVHGDGGAMYTLQALWTQAREKLDVTTVIFANRSYAILNIELARVGAGNPGPKALSMLDLHNPNLDWVHLAQGMGVEASRATTVAEFDAQFSSAMKQRGPRLIEVVLGSTPRKGTNMDKPVDDLELWREGARELMPMVVALRREIHKFPELGLHLPETTRRVKEGLAGLDVDIAESTATTSLIVTLKGATQGPTILLRGDMDALPMPEDTDLEFKSQNEGRMHACGHDSHTAMLVGAVHLLHRHRDKLNGNVKFFFQTGEEGHAGALKVIEEGMLAATPVPNAAFAIHISPNIPTGVLATRPGPLMAATDTIHIEIVGKGGHASQPHYTLDPIPVACEIVTALQSLVTRRIEAFDPVVLSITKIEAGTTQNVIPENARLLGTLRSFSEKSRTRAREGIERVADHIARAHGLEAKVNLVPGYPVTINDAGFVDFAERVGHDLLGEKGFIRMPAPLMGAEDFSYVLQRMPGAMVFLGVAPDGTSHHHAHACHSNRMTMDEGAMANGIAMHAAVAHRYLSAAAS